jgi:hypothetical protein
LFPAPTITYTPTRSPVFTLTFTPSMDSLDIEDENSLPPRVQILVTVVIILWAILSIFLFVYFDRLRRI